MKPILTTLIFLTTICSINAQELFSRAFGNAGDTPVVFLHGGPGYNSANFEVTTAQKLADQGYYVIVYDRRGEGRSEEVEAQFTFKETFADLIVLQEQYGIQKSNLIGHSFGGVVATLFSEEHPDRVASVVLIGAPVSLQETFETIIASSKEIYMEKGDTANLNYIQMLENMDKSSIQYSSYCFAHAMQNGFYSPKEPTAEAKAIYATFGTDETLKENASKMTYQAPQGFWKNENYTALDLTDTLGQLKYTVPVYALYGKDDGLYSEKQVSDLETILGNDQLKYLDRCSHNVFIDQQEEFIAALVEWMK